MMKRSDAATATALLINGYLRANDGEAASPSVADGMANEKRQLGDVLLTILDEVDKWSENLPDDHPINRKGSLEGVLPYDLAQEMVALVGPEEAHRLIDSANGADDRAAAHAAAIAEDEKQSAELQSAFAGVVPSVNEMAIAMIDAVGAPAAEAALQRAIRTPRDV